MATAAELAGLVRDDIARALRVDDHIRRMTLLRAAGRTIFEIAYEEAAGDPRQTNVEAMEFTNTLAGAMNQTFPDGTDEQVERVTAIWAQAAANAAVVAAAGVDAPLTRTWITMLDDKVREMHRPMHGVTIAAGQRFNVGGFMLRYPGEPVGPPEVWINCRCTVAMGAGAMAAAGDNDPQATVAVVERPPAAAVAAGKGDQMYDDACPEGQHRMPDGTCMDDDEMVARAYSAEQRRQMADRGTALPDGSFPIADVEDLRNAIQAIGRAKDPDKARAHIRKRARALGHPELIPDSWTAAVDEAIDRAMGWEPLVAADTHDAPGWVTHPRETQRLRTYWTKGPGAAKIRWGTPGDLTRCERHLAKYVGPQWAWGTCQNLHHAALGFFNPESRGRRGGGDPDEIIDIIDAAFAAAANLEDEMLPPKFLFEQPELDGPTPMTLIANGEHMEYVGHLADWRTCHVGMTDSCVTAPRSPANYAYFRTGEVETDGGPVPVGHITAGTGHAKADLGAAATVAHYDDTGTVVADVAVGEDEWGIWAHGIARPGITDEQLYALRAGAPSGDWRRIAGHLELVGALIVNVPGFPIPRVELAAAAERELSLVAAGIVTVDPNAQSPERIAVAVIARLDEREADKARRARAEALTADIHALRVEALTAAVR